MKSHWQSVGKEAPGHSDNEDASRTDDAAGIWAVADGAGGTGIYAGEWAQHLVNQIPNAPFSGPDPLSHWFEGHWEAFFETHQPVNSADYLVQHKFMHEGSGATLAALHHRPDGLHWSVYGDAVALFFQPATGELRAGNLDLYQFASAPYLLNWREAPHPAGFRLGVWKHGPGQQYALLSDALGQYVLLAYAAVQGDAEPLRKLAKQPTALGHRAQTHLDYWTGNEKSFEEWVWEPLRNALGSPEAFLLHTQQLREQHLLAVDDYTCILLED